MIETDRARADVPTPLDQFDQIALGLDEDNRIIRANRFAFAALGFSKKEYGGSYTAIFQGKSLNTEGS